MNRKRLFSLLFCLLTAIVFVLPVCAENQPATIALEVEKVVTGDRPGAAGTFTFQLEAAGENVPMPAEDTITITGSGKASFGEITYDTPDNYDYTIREVKGTLNGYTYDTTVYDVMVQVLSDDKGVLTANAYVYKDGNLDKSGQIKFVNRYTAPAGEPAPTPTPTPTQDPGTVPTDGSGNGLLTLPQTGDLFNPVLWGVLCAAALLVLIVVWSVRKRNAHKNK